MQVKGLFHNGKVNIAWPTCESHSDKANVFCPLPAKVIPTNQMAFTAMRAEESRGVFKAALRKLIGR